MFGHSLSASSAATVPGTAKPTATTAAGSTFACSSTGTISLDRCAWEPSASTRCESNRREPIRTPSAEKAPTFVCVPPTSMPRTKRADAGAAGAVSGAEAPASSSGAGAAGADAVEASCAAGAANQRAGSMRLPTTRREAPITRMNTAVVSMSLSTSSAPNTASTPGAPQPASKPPYSCSAPVVSAPPASENASAAEMSDSPTTRNSAAQPSERAVMRVPRANSVPNTSAVMALKQ